MATMNRQPRLFPVIKTLPFDPAAAVVASEPEMLSRKAAGRLGASRGRAFEKLLEKHVLSPAVDNQLLLRVDRQHPTMHPTHHRDKLNRPLFVVGACSGADWIALLPKAAPLSYLALEAKTTCENALPLSAFYEHQIQHLNAAVDAGQEGLLFVQFSQPIAENFVVRWSQVPWKKAGKGHSLPRENLRDEWRLNGWQSLARVIGWSPS